jgi:predicted DNA-binding transcriptional regulator AlpA
MIDLDINSIPFEELPRLILALSARLVAAPRPTTAIEPAAKAGDEDRLITTREAAALLGHSKKWIYRNITKLPFARRIGPRDFRFSLIGLRKWQARQRVDAR